jgi:urease accessory protein
VARAYATSPLKWLTPRNHGSAAWVYASTYGGGLVDGDALCISIDVEPDAMALLSTQASTKVYRSPRGTSAETTARVAAGALLVSMPDPVVCFAGARYRQLQEFQLDEDASLVCVESLTAGRSARGERWAFEEYWSRLRVGCAGRLACHDALVLRSSDGPLLDRLGRFDALATIVLVGPRVRQAGERLLAEHASAAPAREPARLFAAAPLAGGDGCIVRMAGVSVEDIWRRVRECLTELPALLGDDPWAGKW